MKKLILMLVLFVSVVSYGSSDWRTQNMKDDFGEYTGKIISGTEIKGGKFDNRFSVNSDLFGYVWVLDNHDYNAFAFYVSRYKITGNPIVRGIMNFEMRNNKNESIKFKSNKFMEYSDINGDLTRFIKRSNGDIRVVSKDNMGEIFRFRFSPMGFTNTLKKLN